MKLTAQTIRKKFNLLTSDGFRFSIDDLLFDDRSYAVEHLVCSYGGLLRPKQAQVSPKEICGVGLQERVLRWSGSSAELKETVYPGHILPVSHEHHKAYSTYPFHPYFLSMGVASVMLDKRMLAYRAERMEKTSKVEVRENHTRSISEVRKYSLWTSDKESADVSDWIVETDQWNICSLVAVFGSYFNQKKYLVETAAIRDISFSHRHVNLKVSKREVIGKSNFDPHKAINVDRRATAYDYYGRRNGSHGFIDKLISVNR